MTTHVVSSLRSWVATGIFLAPIGFCAGFVAIKFCWPTTYHEIIAEDGILENAQVLFYGLASLVAWRAARQFQRAKMRSHAVVWFLLSLALLFVALEEVSWLERIAGFSIDAISTRNTQGETTLHNLWFVQPYLDEAYIIVSAIAAFGWIATKDSLVFPNRTLCLYFLPALLMYSYFEAGRRFNDGEFLLGSISVWRDQEPAETLMSLGFFLHAVLTYVAVKSLARKA